MVLILYLFGALQILSGGWMIYTAVDAARDMPAGDAAVFASTLVGGVLSFGIAALITGVVTIAVGEILRIVRQIRDSQPYRN